jgi:hypothetical protein
VLLGLEAAKAANRDGVALRHLVDDHIQNAMGWLEPPGIVLFSAH